MSQSDWITAAFDAVERCRYVRGKSQGGDPELIDALEQYIGRLGMIVGPKRDSRTLNEAEAYVANMLITGISYLAACSNSIPNSVQWKKTMEENDDE